MTLVRESLDLFFTHWNCWELVAILRWKGTETYIYLALTIKAQSRILGRKLKEQRSRRASHQTSYLCTVSDQIGEILSLRILRLKWGDHVAMNPQTEWGQDPISIYLIFLSPPCESPTYWDQMPEIPTFGIKGMSYLSLALFLF